MVQILSSYGAMSDTNNPQNSNHNRDGEQNDVIDEN